MKALLAALGGSQAVADALGVSKASVKAALYARVFPLHWFGPMASMGATLPEPVAVPIDLFGSKKRRPWASLPITVSAAE